MAHFEGHCSKVMDAGLFVSGESVARNREVLRECGITHVLNCTGYNIPDVFVNELTYKTFYLRGIWDGLAWAGRGRAGAWCAQVCVHASMRVCMRAWRQPHVRMHMHASTSTNGLSYNHSH